MGALMGPAGRSRRAPMAASRTVTPPAYSLSLPLLLPRGHYLSLGPRRDAGDRRGGRRGHRPRRSSCALTFTEVVDTMAGRAALQVKSFPGLAWSRSQAIE